MKINSGNAFLAIIFVSIVSQTALSETRVKSRYIGEKPMAIDGDLGEWRGFGKRNRSIEFTVLDEKAILRGRDAWKDDTDLRAEFAFAHNDKALYLAIRINDQELVRSNQNLTTEDHVEIWFGLPQKGKTPARSFGIGIFPDPDKNKVTIRTLVHGKDRGIGRIRGVESAIMGMNSFYTIEATIPFDALLGEDVLVSDLRAGVYVIDRDKSSSAVSETVFGTAPENAKGSTTVLPRLDQITLKSRVQSIDILLN